MTANVGFFNNNREVTSETTMPYGGGVARFSLDNAIINFNGTYLLGGDLCYLLGGDLSTE